MGDAILEDGKLSIQMKDASMDQAYNGHLKPAFTTDSLLRTRKMDLEYTRIVSKKYILAIGRWEKQYKVDVRLIVRLNNQNNQRINWILEKDASIFDKLKITFSKDLDNYFNSFS